jgi:hypothetical protein
VEIADAAGKPVATMQVQRAPGLRLRQHHAICAGR